LEEVPRLSVSIAHKLIHESPLSAWAAHRLLGNFRKPPTDSQIQGRMWHAAILEESHDVILVDFPDYRTKAAKEEKKRILADGQVPALKAKFELLAPHAERIREQIALRGIKFDGITEQRFEWTEFTDEGRPVDCSGVIDHHQELSIHDLKTGSGATSERQAALLISRSHSVMQDAAYRSALASKKTGIVDVGDFDFTYIFAQTEEPFSVTPVRMAGTFREISHLQWRRAIHLWNDCISKGTEREHWPDVTTGTSVIDAPGWMLSQELELEAMRDG